jgi:aldehyde:ferredoxin oxidoreductase
LYIDEQVVEIRDASHLAGRTVIEVYEALQAELGGDDLSIVQCGPAGENGVCIACLMVDQNNVGGRSGMGAVFGSKNLRAVVVRGNKSKGVAFANPEGLKELNKKAAERLDNSGFPAILRKHGTPGVVAPQAEAGNFATHNYSRSSHPEYQKLHGANFEAEIGAGATTCFGCVVRCRKKVKADTPYPLTDKLGGPEFETLALLGANLDITDAAAVAYANQLCGNYGIDTISMGGLAGYMFECMERGLISEAEVGHPLKFNDPESLFWLIEQLALRQGIGDVLAGGPEAAIARFGEATRPYAVQVKNQGLAVHMPQVKPSLALMYAVCPIGPDHQSSEHDWLLSGGGEERLGLGIFERGEFASTGREKVRMTIYSQYYYSLLDSLCLCMFCWGPGCLYSYRDLEDLVNFSTGWNVTFWELMKVGERRVNMMRQVNAQRGFTRTDDKLPPRLFEPLLDGPKKGHHVDAQAFAQMLDQYYGMAGWDPDTGNPIRGKLIELGLEWTQEQ